MKGFAEAQHVGLGSRIDGEVHHALEGQQTGDKQNLPSSSLPHILRKDVGDRGQARDIELHHGEGCIELAVDEGALQAVAGVIDQEIDLNATLMEPLVQLNDRRNVREIDLL